MKGDGRKAKNPGKTLLRLLGYMKRYIPVLVVVMICIVVASVAQTRGSKNVGNLVDNFILPMVAGENVGFADLKVYLVKLAAIFGLGILASFLNQFLMVSVSQGTQKRIRDEMFTKMQRLPLRYFDSNAAGNIMSRYTSDIDTLRQMISQSIPQTASSIVTLVVVFVTMLTTSWILTCVVMVTVVGISVITVTIVGKAGKFFIGQQRSLGKLNGFVEEMITGQKVVKVFNHETACKEEFDQLNEELCQNAYTAGKLSNMMGPVNNNLGYIQYAILAIVGGVIAVSSGGQLITIGQLMTFMSEEIPDAAWDAFYRLVELGYDKQLAK